MPHDVADHRTIGLIVNPIAGMGGRVGLRGTDGEALLERAVEMGATALAPQRAGLALDRLAGAKDQLSLLAARGEMGEDLALEHGFEVTAVGAERDGVGQTSAADTRDAAIAMVDAGAELILFAGGDGTARVLREAVAERVPVVGIPTGVKMHSGCFARNPATAGNIAADYMSTPVGFRLVERADVVDRVEGEEGSLPGQVLFGSLRVPRTSSRLLGSKSQSSGRSATALHGACLELVESMKPGEVHILGPGSTTGRIREHLGIESDPLAVDVIKDKKLFLGDAAEAHLIELVEGPDRVKLIVGVIGGQGSVLGRGNQQISAEVLRHIDPADVTIVASLEKLIALSTTPLSVDTGDAEIDSRLSGHRPVRIGRKETLIYEVAA